LFIQYPVTSNKHRDVLFAAFACLKKITHFLTICRGLDIDIALYFNDRQDPDFVLCDPPDHGRIEIRKIWTTSELNDYLNFPHAGQAFVIQRAGAFRN
jgi:hypothetical protein